MPTCTKIMKSLEVFSNSIKMPECDWSELTSCTHGRALSVAFCVSCPQCSVAHAGDHQQWPPSSGSMAMNALFPRSRTYRPRNSQLKEFHCQFPDCTKSFYKKSHMDRHQRMKHGCLYRQRSVGTRTGDPEPPNVVQASELGGQEASEPEQGGSGTGGTHELPDKDNQHDGQNTL